jgi:hypothetical protein
VNQHPPNSRNTNSEGLEPIPVMVLEMTGLGACLYFARYRSTELNTIACSALAGNGDSKRLDCRLHNRFLFIILEPRQGTGSREMARHGAEIKEAQ